LSQVDLAVEQGTIVALIGPNGAGKTTLFNVVAGALRPSSGQVVFDGRDITGLPANAVCRLGMARTFQVTRPFAAMTCLENIMVAAVNRHPQAPRAFVEDLARQKLLDEVLGGLNTQEINQAVAFIRSLRDQLGLTVLWIEHVMGAIMQAAERVIVLDQGQVLVAGTPHEVVHDPRVIQAYLGD
jgi:branched-chain amino acid transport system ATP-binding protein